MSRPGVEQLRERVGRGGVDSSERDRGFGHRRAASGRRSRRTTRRRPAAHPAWCSSRAEVAHSRSTPVRQADELLVERLELVGSIGPADASRPNARPRARSPRPTSPASASAESRIVECRDRIRVTWCPSDSHSRAASRTAAATSGCGSPVPSHAPRPEPDAEPPGIGADLLARTDAPAARSRTGRRPPGRPRRRGSPALSRTDRVSTCSCAVGPQSSPKSGPSVVRARVGLSPTRPHHDAGNRIEPPMSLPCAAAHHARRDRRRGAAAGPSVDRARSHGLRVAPYAIGSVVTVLASSGMFVRPSDENPAARYRSTSQVSVSSRHPGPSAPASRSGTAHPPRGTRRPSRGTGRRGTARRAGRRGRVAAPARSARGSPR